MKLPYIASKLPIVLPLLILLIAPLQTHAEHKQLRRLGSTVLALGDSNLNGYQDLVVVASHPEDTGPDARKLGVNTKQLYVYHGSARGFPTRPDLVLAGASPRDEFGSALAAGDFDGDGISDLVSAAPAGSVAAGDDTGTVYVFYGHPQSLGHARKQAINGPRPAARFGHSLTAGDINGDGFDDLLVGALERSGSRTTLGTVRVHLGSSNGLANEAALVLRSDVPGDRFGWKSAIGDLDGNETADIVIGAPLDSAGGHHAGRVYLFRAGASLDNRPDRILDGAEPGAMFGYALDAGADYNGDGKADLAIGAPLSARAAPASGSVVLYQTSINFLNTGGSDYNAVDAPQMNVLTGEVPYGLFGAVIKLADMDLDGIAEIIVGSGGELEQGAVFVYRGGTNTGAAGPTQTLSSPRSHDRFGWTLDVLDADQDGFADLVIGAPENEAGRGTGTAYLYPGGGKSGPPLAGSRDMGFKLQDLEKPSNPRDEQSRRRDIDLAPAGLQINGSSPNVQLLGQLDPHPGQTYSDIWGYAAAGREYALLGVRTGLSIIDVTDATTPVEVAFIPGPQSTWRDIKTHLSYAYVTTEGGGEDSGMQIVDLSDLPNSAALVNTFDTTFTTAHNLYIDQGYAYIAGPSSNGVRILELSDPVNPVEVGAYFAGGYVHDVFVKGDRGYFASGGSQDFDIVDLADKSNPTLLARTIYPFGIYAHQCWTTENDQHLLCDDEFNVVDMLVFDISDLQDIQTTTPFNATPERIHNIFVKGDRAHVSYYAAGYLAFGIEDPASPEIVGCYDTYPGQTSEFVGAWGVYPYTQSDRVYISDINTGLYVVQADLNQGSQTCTESSAPTVLIPPPGSTLTGPSQTFEWTANGAIVTEWWLHIGSFQGGRDIYNSASLGAALSATVTGLPTDGSTVYVKLWHREGGSWKTTEFQYTAHSGPSAALSLDKEILAGNPYDTVGATIDYGYVVSNTGNVAISALGVADDNTDAVPVCNVSAVGNGDAVLDPGETVTCTAFHTVTQADLDAGTVVNHATATGTPAGGTLVDPSDTETATLAGAATEPAITSPAPGAALGGSSQTFVWAANGAVVTEWWLHIGSFQGGKDIYNSGSLGTTLSATVNGLPTDGSSLYVKLWHREGGSWKTTEFQYTAHSGASTALSLDKQILAGNPYDTVGATIDYGYVVSNTGNVAISALAVSDDNTDAAPVCNLAAVGNGDAVLDPGETVTCTALHTVTQADLDAGTVVNHATATGTPAGGTLVDPSDTETATLAGADTEPAIISPAPGAVLSGSSQTFVWSANGAAVTQWWLHIGSFQGGKDIYNSGSLGTTLSATVNGLPTDGSSLYVKLWHREGGSWKTTEFQYTAHSGPSAALSLDKQILAGNPYDTVGATIDYGYVVSNTGNVAVSALAVSDDNTDAAPVCNLAAVGNGDAVLDPGETVTCTAFHTVTQADLDAGTVVNHATATGTPAGGTLVDSGDTETATLAGVATEPAITSPAPGAVLGGSSQTFVWSANGAVVTQWWLHIGSFQGGKDIYDSGSLGTALSDTVNGLPTDGSSLYIKLWHREGGRWKTTEYQYSAADGG